MKIWIDADGCPVVKLATAIARKRQIDVTIVKNHAVEIESDYAEVVTVDLSRDAADYYIVNKLTAGDLVITQDYGLSAMVLAKGGRCINQNGKTIDTTNIDFILDSRHHGRRARMQNHRGPRHKKRTAEDDLMFEQAFEKLLSEGL